VQFGDRYWIEDGHNRVAAALRNGQVEIDAAVTDLRSIAATTSPRATATLAPMLEEGRELRAAGEGRFSAQAASLMASTADDAEQGRGHAHGDGPDDDQVSESAAGTGTAATDEPAPKPRRRISRMPRRRDATAAASAAAAATEATAGEAVDEKPRPKRRRGKVKETAAEPGAQPVPSSGAARDAADPAGPADPAAPAAPDPETTPAPEAP